MLNLEMTARIPTLVYLTYRSVHVALWYFITKAKTAQGSKTREYCEQYTIGILTRLEVK